MMQRRTVWGHFGAKPIKNIAKKNGWKKGEFWLFLVDCLCRLSKTWRQKQLNYHHATDGRGGKKKKKRGGAGVKKLQLIVEGAPIVNGRQGRILGAHQKHSTKIG